MGYTKNKYFYFVVFLLGSLVTHLNSFAQTPVFYLNANGTNGSNTFSDSGPNNYPITVNGNPVNGSNCNNTAAYIDGTTWTPSGHYLFSPANPDFDLGSGDFTVHFWIYLENITTTHAAFDLRCYAAEHISFIHYPATGWLFSDRQSVGNIVSQSNPSMVPQQWTHVALVRSGNIFSIYINGCRVAMANVPATISANNGLAIGFSWDNRDQLNGYIDEFYLYKGTALWTDTFTPPGCSVFSSCITCNAPLLSSVQSYTNVKCKGDSTGSITVSASGGTAPYTYQWNGYASSQTGATASNLPEGTYTVIISDQSCYTDTHTVTITEPLAALIAGVSPGDTTICLEEGIALTATVSGGTLPYSYSWSNGNSDSSQLVTPLIATSYTLTVTDSNSCSADSVINISVNIPIAQFTVAPSCLNDSAHFINSSSVNLGTISSYSWNFGDGYYSSLINPAHLYSASGTYSVTLKIISDQGCIDSVIISLTIYPMPDAEFYANNVCDQTAVLFTDSSDIASTDSIVTWNWNFGDGSALNTNQEVTGGHQYSNSGNYNVQLLVVSSHGCADSITKPVVVYPNPISGFSATTVCNGLTTTYTDTSSPNGGTISSWTWDFGDNTTVNSNQNPTHLYTGCGSFNTQLLITTTDGCKDSTTNAIVVYCLPVPDAGLNDTLCFAESATLVVTPNGSGYSYSWDESVNTNFSTIYNPNVSPTNTTTYTVTLTDANTCSAIDSITVFVDTEILLPTTITNITCNTACNGQISIATNGGVQPYQYAWSGGCTTGACADLCPGTYSLTVTDAWGCVAATVTTITEPGALFAFINTFSPTSCNDTCDGSAAITVTGGTAGYTYLWNSAPSQATVSADSLCSGTYICIVTDANLCQAADTVTITAPPAITLLASTTPSNCNDSTGTVTINALGGTPGYNFTWNPGGQTGATATGLGAAAYTVLVTDANGCTESQTAVVTDFTGPTVIVSASNSTIVSGNSTMLSTTGQGTYLWSPLAGLSCNNCPNPIAEPSESISYCVVVTDTNNCADSSCIEITVEYLCDLTVPSAFSPNNDGHNDRLTLHGWEKCASEFTLLVFNRWGEKVFESDNPLKTWDGSARAEVIEKEGLQTNSAVFVYYLRATLVTGEKIARKGNITVIK